MQIESDVMTYYGYIVLIFVIVKLTLFFTLWTWLRSRVTDRMVELTNKINNNEQIEDKSRVQANDYEKKTLTEGTSPFEAHGRSTVRGGSMTSTRSRTSESSGDLKSRASVKLGKLGFSRDTVADAVDTVLFETNKEGDKGDSAKSKKKKKNVVNEIDELNEAMFALFKEQ